MWKDWAIFYKTVYTDSWEHLLPDGRAVTEGQVLPYIAKELQWNLLGIFFMFRGLTKTTASSYTTCGDWWKSEQMLTLKATWHKFWTLGAGRRPRKKEPVLCKPTENILFSNSPRRNMYYLCFCFYIFRVDLLSHISPSVDTFWEQWWQWWVVGIFYIFLRQFKCITTLNLQKCLFVEDINLKFNRWVNWSLRGNTN